MHGQTYPWVVLPAWGACQVELWFTLCNKVDEGSSKLCSSWCTGWCNFDKLTIKYAASVKRKTPKRSADITSVKIFLQIPGWTRINKWSWVHQNFFFRQLLKSWQERRSKNVQGKGASYSLLSGKVTVEPPGIWTRRIDGCHGRKILTGSRTTYRICYNLNVWNAYLNRWTGTRRWSRADIDWLSADQDRGTICSLLCNGN
jgi:hypothetical protein